MEYITLCYEYELQFINQRTEINEFFGDILI